jgi:hypothetical protein
MDGGFQHNMNLISCFSTRTKLAALLVLTLIVTAIGVLRSTITTMYGGSISEMASSSPKLSPIHSLFALFGLCNQLSPQSNTEGNFTIFFHKTRVFIFQLCVLHSFQKVVVADLMVSYKKVA